MGKVPVERNWTFFSCSRANGFQAREQIVADPVVYHQIGNSLLIGIALGKGNQSIHKLTCLLALDPDTLLQHLYVGILFELDDLIDMI
ncbi:hypothetical protein OPV22_035216 [Ensete ventricosum]|uniref:Uncharacterized protein n=1 Tax=Ensete ventricosum TaxID=4639 RepID=A0AAX5JZU5_ENSVE|nr:hypothetical protein OPV22_035217 [Ensete ventricosum]KAJ8454527.1 hypothetical protein OPV22_035216 [Ensete ventricosum]